MSSHPPEPSLCPIHPLERGSLLIHGTPSPSLHLLLLGTITFSSLSTSSTVHPFCIPFTLHIGTSQCSAVQSVGTDLQVQTPAPPPANCMTLGTSIVCRKGGMAEKMHVIATRSEQAHSWCWSHLIWAQASSGSWTEAPQPLELCSGMGRGSLSVLACLGVCLLRGEWPPCSCPAARLRVSPELRHSVREKPSAPLWCTDEPS